jgi:hypothetical protein
MVAMPFSLRAAFSFGPLRALDIPVLRFAFLSPMHPLWLRWLPRT